MPKGRHLSWVWGRKPPVTTLWTTSSDHLFLAPWNNLEPYKSHDHVNKSKTTSFSHLQRSLFFFLKLTDQKKKVCCGFLTLQMCLPEAFNIVLSANSSQWKLMNTINSFPVQQPSPVWMTFNICFFPCAPHSGARLPLSFKFSLCLLRNHIN